MADTAIADVQRRATEKLPHFVYPPAKPKFTSSGQSLILVSDNLEKHEMLIKATLATTTVVAVKYDSMSLADLGDAISKSAPAGTAFDAVGVLDHGAPGRFCLLKSVGGGDIDLADLATDASIAAFFKGIGGLVKPGGRIDLLGCSVAALPSSTSTHRTRLHCSSHLALVANTFLARFLAFLLSLVLALVCRRCRERSFEGVR